jgi:hypothetical protein
MRNGRGEADLGAQRRDSYRYCTPPSMSESLAFPLKASLAVACKRSGILGEPRLTPGWSDDGQCRRASARPFLRRQVQETRDRLTMPVYRSLDRENIPFLVGSPDSGGYHQHRPAWRRAGQSQAVALSAWNQDTMAPPGIAHGAC